MACLGVPPVRLPAIGLGCGCRRRIDRTRAGVNRTSPASLWRGRCSRTPWRTQERSARHLPVRTCRLAHPAWTPAALERARHSLRPDHPPITSDHAFNPWRLRRSSRAYRRRLGGSTAPVASCRDAVDLRHVNTPRAVDRNVLLRALALPGPVGGQREREERPFRSRPEGLGRPRTRGHIELGHPSSKGRTATTLGSGVPCPNIAGGSSRRSGAAELPRTRAFRAAS